MQWVMAGNQVWVTLEFTLLITVTYQLPKKKERWRAN